MTDEPPVERLVETARTDPDAVDPDDLAGRLRTGTATDRASVAAAVGYLALAGRNVEPCFDPLRGLYGIPDALAEPARLSVSEGPEGAFQPRAVAFATATLAVTGAIDTEVWLTELVDAHRDRYPEFDADARTYTAVREVGWAFASVVIYTDRYTGAVLALLDDDSDLLRRLGAEALSDVAEEYAPIRGRLPETTARVVDALADRLATDADPRVRYYAAFGLHEFGLDDPATITDRIGIVRGALDDESPLVRKEAAGALAVAGATDALEDLRRLSASDPDSRVREAADEAAATLADAE